MKSKYSIYALLFFIVYSGYIGAMEKEVDIVALYKKEWHATCISCAFLFFLAEKALSFEVAGSKDFIANELGKALDNPASQDDYLKTIAMQRNESLQMLKGYSEKNYSFLMRDSIRKVHIVKLLPFILSLEERINKRIIADNRTIEIEWRKTAYRWLDPWTRACKDIEQVLKLDIEKDFSLEDLQTNYRYNY